MPLTLFRLVVLTPVPAEHVGSYQTAYRVTAAPVLMFLILPPEVYVALVAVLDEDHPRNTRLVFANVFIVVAVHALS